MASYLIWAMESAIIGLWAIALSSFSSPFHNFIARSHVIIAGFTLLLQLVASAQNFPIQSATADAFVCTVGAIVLLYAVVLLDPGNFSSMFSMPVVGILPLDACIGLAWCIAAMVSACGMALCDSTRRTALMLHPFGYHMIVVLPSFLSLWLYDYDASNLNEPVTQIISKIQRAAHAVLFVVLACIWATFILLQTIGQSIKTESNWPATFEEMSNQDVMQYCLHYVLTFIGRGGPVLIAVSGAITANTNAQAMLLWTLTGLAAWNAVDVFELIRRCIPSKDKVNERSQSADSIDNSPASAPLDPAAVPIPSTQAHFFVSGSRDTLWRRDKMV